MIKDQYDVTVGMYTYGSCFDSNFNTGGKIEIGNYCSFGPNVRYFGANHPINYVSMSPYFYQKKWSEKIADIKVSDVKRNKLVIGNDCWIGAGVTILSRCHYIGNGAVVGAGSIVTKDVPPYSIVVGNPAKVIGYRFENDIISIIENSKWYNKRPEELLEFYEDIDNQKVFCEKLKLKK